MKKSLLLILVALACLFFAMPNNKEADAAEEVTWELVKDASTLAVGDQIVIAAKDKAVALSTTQNKNNRGQTSIVKSGDTISTPGSSVQILTLKAGKSSGTFAFYTGNGYLYAASSSNNYLKTETSLSANSSWNITIDSKGVATIKATGTNARNLLKHNSASSLFSCYGSGQNDVVLYKKVIYTSETPVLPENLTDYDSTLGALFTKYRNISGENTYTKETNIYIDDTNEKFVQEVSSLVHAADSIKNVQLNKKTYYKGDYLFFEDGRGYGTVTENGTTYLTSGNYRNGEFVSTTTHKQHPGMEEYYCTLNDFVSGSHESEHVNAALSLKSDWQVLGEKKYYSTNKDVIDAFVLFTAPTWLQLNKSDCQLYIDYQGVTVEESNGKLVMTLWAVSYEGASETNKGKLKTKPEEMFVDAEGNAINAVKFSEAIISNEAYTEKAAVTKVTSNEQLVDGAQLLIAYTTAAGNTFAMSTINAGTYQNMVAITFLNDKVTLVDKLQVVTLVKDGNHWKLKLGDNQYLYYKNSSNEVYVGNPTTAGQAQWDITVKNDGSVTIANVAQTERLLQYNSSYSRFACYKSTSKQYNPSLYIIG